MYKETHVLYMQAVGSHLKIANEERLHSLLVQSDIVCTHKRILDRVAAASELFFFASLLQDLYSLILHVLVPV